MSLFFLSALGGNDTDSKEQAPCQSHLKWNAVPSASPAVIRNCPKCKEKKAFRSSGLFRVNANGRALDIWLVYRCESCGTSWNMEVRSRVSPQSIGRERYEQYLKNDADLALACAFDRRLHRNNKVTVDYASFDIFVQGDDLDPQALRFPVHITLSCRYELEIRAEIPLIKKLGVSRARFRSDLESGKIICRSGDLRRLKLVKPVELLLNP